MEIKTSKCLNCGKDTKFGGQTCSRVCSDEFKKKKNREERICLCCNKKFIVKKKLPNKFCSEVCRKQWAQIPENIENRVKASLKAVKEKYNVNSVFQLVDVQKKSKETKKHRYGNENFVNNKKAKETKKCKHGNENFVNSKKAKETKSNKYNDQNYNNRIKAEETMNKVFGISHVMKLDKYKNKVKKTNINNFGVEYPLQNIEILKKMNKTVNDKYGVNNVSQLDSVKNKIKEKYYEKFDLTKIHFLLEKSEIKLLDEYKGVREKNNEKTCYNVYNFKCLKCGYNFQGTFSNNRLPICRQCYPLYKNNKMHLEFKEFLNSNNVNFYDNTKQIIFPAELDFFLYDNNVAVELNGNYWHSELGGEKDFSYHINKTIKCNEKGIKLIHIFEDEWIFKKDIVKSRILNYINKTKNNLYARKCLIEEIGDKEKGEFLEFNHLMGNSKDSVRIALKFNDEIVSVMTFSKRRLALGKNKTAEGCWELNRFCSKINFNVIGAFGKLLKFFINKYCPYKITTYADIRWSGLNYKETVYFKNKFKFIHKAPPSFWYFKKNDYLKRYHRFTFNKIKLLKVFNSVEKLNNLTGWELAQSLKMDRIWDCGTLKFEIIC